MKANELVSIGMPVYNGAAHIKNALDSLLMQTYSNIEFIISDDASQDETALLCEKYAGRDNRIKFIKQEKNLSLVKNFAFVLGKAKGKYFMWAAQDDWWEKTFVEKTVRALETHPEHVVAMSHFKIIRSGSEKPEETVLGSHDFTNFLNYKLYKTILAAKDNPIFEYGLWRRDFLVKLFSRLKPKCIEDTVILISEAALAGRFYSVKEFLHVKYRDPRPLRERHYLGEYYKEPFPYTKFLWTGFIWHLTSGAIPFRRKFFIFWPWLKKVWLYKGKVLREWLGFIK